MNISNEMWRTIKNLKQELLNLKQTKKANCASKYYSATASVQGNYKYWVITYKSGTQPIISEVLSFADTALSAPIGNQQYLFAYSQTLYDLVILSTREIDSIVGIS